MSESFQKTIDAVYDGLSKSHKKIADFIKANREKASFMTAADLGEAVGVSESTTVRFAARVGFDGYPALRKRMRESVKRRLTSVQRMDAAANGFGGDDFIDKVFASDIEAIKATRESISREALLKSAEAINRARKIYILGVGSSAAIASFAAFYLRFIYDDVVLADSSESSELFERTFRISADDACVAVSFPRYSAQTAKALSFAKERGATIISITDGETSPIAPFATYLLTTKSNIISFVDSLAAPLSVVNALLVATAKSKGDEAYNDLKELEKIWEEYQVYRVESEDGE